MEPEEEAQGCGAAVPAQEVDQSLATAVSDLESPHVDSASAMDADAGAIHKNPSQNEDENTAGQNPDTTDITASPQFADPQVETSLEPHTDSPKTDFPDSPTIEKGKQPQEILDTPGFVAMDDAIFSEAPPPLTSPLSDISPIHIAVHFPDPSIADQGKQPRQFYYSSDPIATEASSSSTAPSQPAPDITPVSTAGLAHGQPVLWELDPERPAQKLPIRFKDSLGRTMLIPWRRAKTWDGMKMTIDAQFMGLGAEGLESVLGNAVANGRYSLHVSLPSSVEPLKRKSTKPSSHFNPTYVGRNTPNSNGSNDMAAGHENGNNFNHNISTSGSSPLNNNSNNGNGGINPNNSNGETTTPHMRPMIILPEFWDELIQPGSYVSMAMWPRIPQATYDMVPPNLAGLPPPNHGVGLINQPPVMPPMAPLPPRIFRAIDPRDTRPKTRPSSGRPRKRI